MINSQSNKLKEDIRAACFDLSVSLMWNPDALAMDKIENNIEELQIMTEEFYKSADFYFRNIESLEGKSEILIRAIKYIDNIHAIPPLRNNFDWFHYTLGAVIEFACPNGRLKKNNLIFLADIEKGMADYRNNVLDDDD